MNQGIAFSRTLRALDADDFRASKFGLLAAAALLAVWTWWMLAASLPQYESTTNVTIESGHAIAYFPQEVLARIRTNQPALVRFDNSASFPARVQSVTADHAELAFTNRQPPTANREGANAEIETTRVSPATLALRTVTRGNR